MADIELKDALAQLDNTTEDIQIGNVLLTKDGGIALKYTNKTGAASVKGTLVDNSLTVDDAVAVASANSYDHIGVMYEDGIADGSDVWVVVLNDAYALLEDGTAATKGYWVRPSTTVAGRVDITLTAPSGGTIGQLDEHFREVGHCEESVTSGTDKLAKIHLHFN